MVDAASVSARLRISGVILGLRSAVTSKPDCLLRVGLGLTVKLFVLL